MANIKPAEVSVILKQQLEGFKSLAELEEVGTVLTVGDGIARIYGLSNAESNEMIEFDSGVKGIVLNLEEDNVGAVILGLTQEIKAGDTVKRLGRIASIEVGEGLLGRVINTIGEAIDGKGVITGEKFEMPLERKAPGVIFRQPVSVPLQTGLKAIDSMIPVGRGQRELIIGDRQTGKTAVAIDAIINQKGEDLICIYVAIGQKESKVSRIVAELEKHGAMDHTIVVVAGASDPAALSFIAPYAGTSMAEYFMDKGKDVLIIHDDLSKHAWAYRQISLILRRPPGREAYPGDIFYLHSRLLERSARLNEDYGGGSITALPIIETQAGDVSAYIPTNVISITDGQIFLESELFFTGQRPAVNAGISVSRVGGNAQIKAMKKVASKVKLELAQYRELASFSQFGSDIDKDTKNRLDHGKILMEILKQRQYSPVDVADQVMIIYAAINQMLVEVEVEKIKEFEKYLYPFIDTHYPMIKKAIKETGEMKEDIEMLLKKAITEYKKTDNIKEFLNSNSPICKPF